MAAGAPPVPPAPAVPPPPSVWQEVGEMTLFFLAAIGGRVEAAYQTARTQLPVLNEVIDRRVRQLTSLSVVTFVLMLVLSMLGGHPPGHDLTAIGHTMAPVSISHDTESSVTVESDMSFEPGDTLVIGRGTNQESVEVVDVSKDGKTILAMFSKPHPKGTALLTERSNRNWVIILECIIAFAPLFGALYVVVYALRPSLVLEGIGVASLIPSAETLLGRAYNKLLFWTLIPLGLGALLALTPISNDPTLLFPIIVLAAFAGILHLADTQGKWRIFVKVAILGMIILILCLFLGGRKHVEKRTNVMVAKAEAIAETTGTSLVNLTKPAHPDFKRTERCDETFDPATSVIIYDGSTREPTTTVRSGCFGSELILPPEMARGFCWQSVPQNVPDSWYIAFEELDAHGHVVKVWGPYDNNSSYEKIHGTHFRLQGGNVRFYTQAGSCAR